LINDTLLKGTIMTVKNKGMLAGIDIAQVVTSQVNAPGLEPLNRHELQAIENLCAWVAEEQDVAPETVRSVTEVSFGAHDVGAILRKDYDEVIRFLLDLSLNDMRN
jgi:hypothetical protein